MAETFGTLAYLYDGTAEGLFTAVFKAYENHDHPRDVKTLANYQPRFGQRVREIATDFALAQRVVSGLARKAGKDSSRAAVEAALSDDPGAGFAVYRFIRHAMAFERQDPPRYHAIDDIAHPAVQELYRIRKLVRNERHHYIEFMRFQELEGGIWFAQCSPRANVTALLMDWFVDRFAGQPFIIYDDSHEIAGVYDGTNPWYLISQSLEDIALPEITEEEQVMQEAWRGFYHACANQARYNPELRRQLMPKRFWSHLTEFKDGRTGLR